MSDLRSVIDIKSATLANPITYIDVANKLLNDKLLLTALELHTELLESGRELKQLRDFFSNPGNFEQVQDTSPRLITRSESQATLDSLDLTRYSEDGGGTDERVAVLEFELRKARETINALRNNLTVATESETSTPDKGSLKHFNVGTIKPHEQRALNFLINEYLLLYGYKLTSITFADENEEQDFDDWDDVGLNISKPLELLTLYREGLKQTGQNCVHATAQTDEYKNEEINSLEQERNDLKLGLEKLEKECIDLKNTNSELNKENELILSQLPAHRDDLSIKTIPCSKDSLGSESPSEKFEIIDKNLYNKKRDSIVTLEDNISNNSFNANDWTNLSMTSDHRHNEPKGNEINDTFFNINIGQETFKKELFMLCYVNIPQKVDNDILENLLNHRATNDNLIHILSQSLLKIIPNVILNKRDEVIPLLISAILLNQNTNERDKLLQQLFNLKKKPIESERTMILTGIVGIAKFSQESMVENEILPHCWEQLSHKHVERRLLVAEGCNALIPYVSSQIRNSLMLSMLQQMLEDRDEEVRKSVIKALSLVIVLCDDNDKYTQCEELAFGTLNDYSLVIVNLSIQLLFPVIANWALHNGRLTSTLLKHLLHKLNDYLKDSDVSNKLADKILSIVSVLENVLPFLLMSIASQEHILSIIDKNMAMEIRPDLMKLCSKLTNPMNFYKSETNVGMILFEFENYIEKNMEKSWPELDWLIDMMIPDLLNNLNHIEINQSVLLQSFINLFSHLCYTFGRSFTKLKIEPLFRQRIQSLEQILSSFNQFCSSLNIIPVYLVSILSYCDKEELSVMLNKFLCALPLCGTPLDCLEITVKGLCDAKCQQVVVASLWEGVVHQRPLVRSVTANLFAVIIASCDDHLLNSKVTPALVTLASDSDILVRMAAIPALGSLITDCCVKEIHDKAYMQMQSYISDTSLKENHTLLRQLIITLGNIVSSCTPQFRQEVILPELSSMAMYMSQMTNLTRKVDLAQALVEAFTNVVYSPFSQRQVDPLLLPGLRCLETVVTENHSLISQREMVLSMIKECDRRFESPTSPIEKSSKLSHNVNQGMVDMKQRVNKIVDRMCNF